MGNNSIIVHNVDVQELADLLKSSLKHEFDNLRKSLSLSKEDELMTREEACNFLKIDSSTLWAWSKKGKVKSYGIANRRYYKKSEILSCLTPINN